LLAKAWCRTTHLQLTHRVRQRVVAYRAMRPFSKIGSVRVAHPSPYKLLRGKRGQIFCYHLRHYERLSASLI
jgi:hypothetical protein